MDYRSATTAFAVLAILGSPTVDRQLSQGLASEVTAVAGESAVTALRVSENGHYLVNTEGRPIFMLADTGWGLVVRLERADTTSYLEQRKQQGFNAIAFVLYTPRNGSISTTSENLNAYGAAPFVRVNGRPDPMQPLVTEGTNPSQASEYDFWDHVDFTLAEMKRLGMYAFVLPCWGNEIASEVDPNRAGSGPFFSATSAREYGRWLGIRYGSEPHVAWMLGGDRPAVEPKSGADFRPEFRAMAEGLRIGDKDALISYHSFKAGLQSGDWFHHDDWLTYNSIQLWPEAQIAGVTRDWNAAPSKPTWIFEGRYEGYWKRDYKESDWGEWQMRQQAWQTVLAGSFGHTYGHERVFGFGRDGVNWKLHVDSPGARSMTHLANLMRSLKPEVALQRIPDQSLVVGDTGQAERLKSNRITAGRLSNGSLAVLYIANGRSFKIEMSRLCEGPMEASWFNPRTGKWQANEKEMRAPTAFVGDIRSGTGAGEYEFDPPGEPSDENDWVLLIRPPQSDHFQ